jgi:hypothetical protein
MFFDYLTDARGTQLRLWITQRGSLISQVWLLSFVKTFFYCGWNPFIFIVNLHTVVFCTLLEANGKWWLGMRANGKLLIFLLPLVSNMTGLLRFELQLLAFMEVSSKNGNPIGRLIRHICLTLRQQFRWLEPCCVKIRLETVDIFTRILFLLIYFLYFFQPSDC